MKKAVKIVLGVLGALGIGLVGLILACHFNPGLSDSIANLIYNNKFVASAKSSEDGLLSDEEEKSKLIGTDGEALESDAAQPNGSTDSGILPQANQQEEPAGEVVVTPVELKSLEDYGLTQDDVIDNVQDYFENCFKQLSKGKGDDITFYNVVRDSMLKDDVLRSYDDNSYRAGFMDQFMDDYKVSTCGWNVDVEELQAGYYLVTHSYVRGEDIAAPAAEE